MAAPDPMRTFAQRRHCARSGRPNARSGMTGLGRKWPFLIAPGRGPAKKGVAPLQELMTCDPQNRANPVEPAFYVRAWTTPVPEWRRG